VEPVVLNHKRVALDKKKKDAYVSYIIKNSQHKTSLSML
jgi:hypothetical protein